MKRIILIGNYKPDRQESMRRFAQMLLNGYQQAGINAEIWLPTVLFGGIVASTSHGVGKWLGYIDKWIIFPAVIKWRLFKREFKAPDTYFHICDHSNSPYLKHLPYGQSSITCHDALAIRGALGYPDTYCSASRTGVYFQKWILSNLSRSKIIVCVSELTLNHLKEILPAEANQRIKFTMIHNALNAPFGPAPANQLNGLLVKAGVPTDKPFILHIGSGLARKNRSMLLKMVASSKDGFTGNICYAGQAVGSDLLDEARILGLQERVFSIVRPDHETLQALYTACFAFVFPSFSEGFGWPVIEAQACGAPVIASDLAPMPEVGGGAALYADPDSPPGFAGALATLNDPDQRAGLIEAGYKNISRFDNNRMIQAYIKIYQN